jgi:hypothetical protein
VQAIGLRMWSIRHHASIGEAGPSSQLCAASCTDGTGGCIALVDRRVR